MEHKAPPSPSFTSKELEVSEILLQLPSLILQSKFDRHTFKATWGCTKPRYTSLSEPGIDKTSRTESETPVSCLPIVVVAHKKPKNLKRKRGELFEIINQFSKRIESFKKEIANVKSHNETLKSFNSKLKERKQELMSSCMRSLGIPDLNVPLDHVKSFQSQAFDLNDALDEDCEIVESALGFDLNETLNDDDCVVVEPAQVVDLEC